MTDTAVLLTDEYLEAAETIVRITALEKELAEEKAAAKQVIEKVLAIGDKGVSPDGVLLVTVRAGAARFDPDLATRNLPADILASISVTVPDAKRAKAILAPALLEMCQSHNKPSVVAL